MTEELVTRDEEEALQAYFNDPLGLSKASDETLQLMLLGIHAAITGDKAVLDEVRAALESSVKEQETRAPEPLR